MKFWVFGSLIVSKISVLCVLEFLSKGIARKKVVMG